MSSSAIGVILAMKTNRPANRFFLVLLSALAMTGVWSPKLLAQQGDPLAYLEDSNPWYPHTTFPKLTTPQWVGEEGVEAVIILAIDDMRESAKYEAFLRPILQRLKQIDGRAPLSIMTCKSQPDDPQLQSWLDEGLSLEVHTVDHPCPLLKDGDFAAAKSTYDRCVDLLGSIPRNKPVAFRMPCCDSLNTVSPRFFSEIFNRTTPNGNFLSLSSSVFNVFTPEDKSIPRELLFDKEGRERFRKYIPHQSNSPPKYRFNNFIENYPYPYVINKSCWEFPCIVPSDWEAQALHKPNNPQTVADMQAAIDITVHKQGVFCLVFHPHGWIRNDQVVELIDHAVRKHGNKVKFLNFAEAQSRLNKHLLENQPLRDAQGQDNGVRLADVNQDGFLDVIIGNAQKQETRIWQPNAKSYTSTPFAPRLNRTKKERKSDPAVASHFVSLPDWGELKFASVRPLSGFASGGIPPLFEAKRFQDGKWVDDPPLQDLMQNQIKVGQKHPDGELRNLTFHAINEHGSSLALVTRKASRNPEYKTTVFWWSAKPGVWQTLRANIPAEAAEALAESGHPRLRFADVDENGEDDLILSPKSTSDPLRFWLMDWFATGKAVELHLPESVKTMPIVRGDGSDNGFFVRDRHLCWQNEDTSKRPDLLHRVSFDDILQEHLASEANAGRLPPPRTPEQSAAMIQVRPGLTVELAAAEPLIRDPVAFDWDITGRLWVVEMGGYPNGTDGQGKGCGRVQVLTDTDQDGRYDTAATFLEGLNFPTGIQLWRNGAIITAAPEIFYAEDTTGDGQADVRKTLFRGFVEGNQQHRVNGLGWGLDNWLYAANGDSGGMIETVNALNNERPNQSAAVSISGRDFRIRPDLGLIDPQSGQSQFGRNRDDWGNWFGCNNSHPLFHYALADHYLRRNPHVLVKTNRYEVPITPGAAPVFPLSYTQPRFNDFHTANRFTSACSTMIYRDQLLGEEFQGNVFISEPVHNLVSRLVLTREGNTFTGQRAGDETDSEFLASRDNWFRPTTIRTGPDGALWVADMYRAVIEHPKWIPEDWQAKLDLRAGHELGRIYRVVPVNSPHCCQPVNDNTRASTTDPSDKLRCYFSSFDVPTQTLVERLASPSGWWRDTAQRLLLHKQDKTAIPLLEDMVRENASPLARLHALCTLDGLDALSSRILVTALEDKNSYVRQHAVRLSGSRASTNKDVAKALEQRLADEDLMVLMQLAYSAGEMPAKQAGPILAALLKRNESNTWLAAAALSSLNAGNMEEVLSRTIDADNVKPASQSRLATLIGQAAAFGKVEAIQGPLLRLLPEPDHALSAAQWETLAAVVQEIQRHPQAAKSVFQSSPLAARWSSAVLEARRLIVQSDAEVPARMAAVRFVGIGSILDAESIEILEKLLVPQSPDALQKTIVSVLAETGREGVPKQLLANWRSHSPGLRAAILDALFEQKRFQSAVLDALESEAISVVDVDTVRRERLLTLGTKQQQARAAKLFQSAASSNREQVVQQFAEVLKTPGDVARGRQVFEKRCAACHKMDGIGKSIGADLGSLKDRSGPAMLTAILDPNRAVEAKFLSFTAATLAGQTYTGMLLTETGTSITLIGADGKEQVIPRAELDQLSGSNRSLMPEGFEKDLTIQDLADVIRFIQTNAEPRKAASGQ